MNGPRTSTRKARKDEFGYTTTAVITGNDAQNRYINWVCRLKLYE